MNIARIIGLVGLLLIVGGVLARKPAKRNIAFILGGSALFMYSLLIDDGIFALLQLVFVGSAAYELLREGHAGR